MNNDMSQQFAEIILFWLALARSISGDDIKALFIEPAKQFIVFVRDIAGEVAAFFDRQLGPEIEPGGIFAKETRDVFVLSREYMNEYLTAPVGSGFFYSDDQTTICPIVIAKEVANVFDGVHLFDLKLFEIFEADHLEYRFVRRFEIDLRGHPGVESLLPSHRDEAPFIAIF